MFTELVICHSGEPLGWLDELPASIHVTVYDTGLRRSKHGAEAMAERRLGYSFQDWEAEHRHPGMLMHRHNPHQRLSTVAAQGMAQINHGLRSLRLVKEIATAVLEEWHQRKPDHAVETISVTNDHHLRESAHWLRHIIRRFDTLAEVTVFAHGWPFDHISDMVERIRSAAATVSSWTLLPPAATPRDIFEKDIRWQVEKLLRFAGDESDASRTVWVSGTQFAATREVLQGPGLAFWEALLALSESLGPRAAEALERCYHAILTHAATCAEAAPKS